MTARPPENGPPDLEENLRRIFKVSDRLFFSRGYYLNMTVMIENELDDLLHVFYEIPEARRGVFKSSVMGARGFGLRAKVRALDEALYQLVREKPSVGFEAMHRAAVKALDRVIDFRNRLAHEEMSVDSAAAWTSDAEPTFTLTRYSQGRTHEDTFTPDDMRAERQRVEGAYDAIKLLKALVAREVSPTPTTWTRGLIRREDDADDGAD